MFCESCGNQMAPGSTVCNKCGAPTAGMQTAAPPPVQVPPAYAQPQYAPPPAYQPAAAEMTVGAWMITLLVSYIPIVGFIMMLVWAFGSGAPPSKRNYCRAALIFSLIGVVLSFVVLPGLLTALAQAVAY